MARRSNEQVQKILSLSSSSTKDNGAPSYQGLSTLKPENEDPLLKWIRSYATKLSVLSRFFKWPHYPNNRLENNTERDRLGNERQSYIKKYHSVEGIVKAVNECYTVM
jgi:hypothetical protein